MIRTITLVEVIENGRHRGERHEVWEFACNACGELCTNLTLGEARAELEHHVCAPKEP